MTYVDWIKKYPLPRNFIRLSAPILANNVRLDPSDSVERTLQTFHRRMWARGAR